MFSFAVCRLELIYRESVGITEQAVWCAHSISCWLESARISTCAVSARATGVWPFPITGESLGFHCLFLQEFFAGHCNISLLWHHCRWLPFQRKHTKWPNNGFLHASVEVCKRSFVCVLIVWCTGTGVPFWPWHCRSYLSDTIQRARSWREKKNKSEGAMLSPLDSVRPNVEFPVHLC